MFKIDYNKPGKGVNKRDPNKPRISIFFELLFRKLWRLIKVNMLYMITAIPTFLVTMLLMGFFSSRITNALMPVLAEVMGVSASDMSNPEFVSQVLMLDVIIRVVFAFLFTLFLGQGPATAGITYILRNYAREEHAWMLSDWWQHTKSNFRQSLVIWIIDLIVVCMLVVAFDFYSKLGGAASYLIYVIIFISIVYLIMHFYIYQLMITFENSIKNIFRNAFVLAMQRGPQNLLILLILVALHIGIPYIGLMSGWTMGAWLIFAALEVFLLVAVSGFMVNFFVYPQLEIHIKAFEEKAEKNDEELN